MFGVLILAFSAFLADKDASSIWLEVVDVAAWVFFVGSGVYRFP